MTCIHYASGYRYQLRRPHVEKTAVRPPARIETDWLALDPDGTLYLFAGYAWDGASGPTFDSKSSMRASLSHDGFYQLLRLGLLAAEWREAVDAEFHRICREDGMWSWRAALWHQAVRRFASPAADPAQVTPDECAPGGDCCNAPGRLTHAIAPLLQLPLAPDSLDPSDT